MPVNQSQRLKDPNDRPGDPIPASAPDVRIPLTDRPLMAMKATEDYVSRYQWDPAWGDMHLTRGVGSSTLVDTDGDVFHESALKGMAEDSVDLNVLLNHLPSAPYSIYGSVLETDLGFMTLHDGTRHAVLKIVTDVEREQDNKIAWDTYRMIAGIDRKARKLGFSVGCLYIDAKPRRNAKGVYRGADVFEVLPVEFSVVTMPANRLAWIETIGRDMQAKGILPPGQLTTKYMASQPVIEVVRDWMDFGPVDGPRLEKIAAFFEDTYGLVFARPRSA